jgi:hypothetical protein
MFKKYLTALLLSLVSSTALAITTVDLVGNPLSGNRPLNVTLTWTSVETDACVRNGVAVATGGTETIIGLTVDTTYTLTCSLGNSYADVTWIAPTTAITGNKLADGTCETKPLPATGPEALAGYRIVYNTSLAALAVPPLPTTCTVPTAQPVGTIINISNPASGTYRIQNLPNGPYFVTIAAINNAGGMSTYTNPVSKIVNYQVATDTVSIDVQNFGTSETTVYNLVKKTNGFIFVAVGTVPLNTTCDLNQTVNGYYAVPVASVTWTGTVRPVVVVARCVNQ